MLQLCMSIIPYYISLQKSWKTVDNTSLCMQKETAQKWTHTSYMGSIHLPSPFRGEGQVSPQATGHVLQHACQGRKACSAAGGIKAGMRVWCLWSPVCSQRMMCSVWVIEWRGPTCRDLRAVLLQSGRLWTWSGLSGRDAYQEMGPGEGMEIFRGWSAQGRSTYDRWRVLASGIDETQECVSVSGNSAGCGEEVKTTAWT